MVALLASCTASAKDSALTSQKPSLPTTVAGAEQSATDLTTDSAPGAVAAKDQSFGVAPPEHWVDETAKQRKTVLFLKDPKPTAKIFRAFSVIRTSLDKPLPLNDLVEQGMIGQRQQGATVTKVADRRIGGVPAAGYHMTRTAEKDKGGAKVSQTQYYVVRGTTVYITTLTAAAADRREATKLQDSILNSWSWGAPTKPTESGSAAGTGTGRPKGGDSSSKPAPTTPAPEQTPAPSSAD